MRPDARRHPGRLDGPFKFSQIKEKYGTLRVYWDGALSPGADAQVEEAIALAEARSAVICEVCGAEGSLRDGAWLTTRCEAHAEGRPAVEAKAGFENMRTKWTADATSPAGATTAPPMPSSMSTRPPGIGE